MSRGLRGNFRYLACSVPICEWPRMGPVCGAVKAPIDTTVTTRSLMCQHPYRHAAFIGPCTGGLDSVYSRDMDTEHADAAREALSTAEQLAGVAVDTAEDGHVAFSLATTLADAWQQAADRVTHLRGRAAARIRDEEALSLQALGDGLGMSRSRVHQMIKKAGSHE